MDSSMPSFGGSLDTAMDFEISGAENIAQIMPFGAQLSPNRTFITPKNIFAAHSLEFQQPPSTHLQAQPHHVSSLLSSTFDDTLKFSLRSPARNAEKQDEEHSENTFIEPMHVEENTSPVENQFGDASDALLKQYDPTLFYNLSPPENLFSRSVPQLSEHHRSMSADFSRAPQINSSDVLSDSEIETKEKAPKKKLSRPARRSRQQSPRTSATKPSRRLFNTVLVGKQVVAPHAVVPARILKTKAPKTIENELASIHPSGLIEFRRNNDAEETVVEELKSFPHPHKLNVIADPQYMTVRTLNSDDEEEVDYAPKPLDGEMFRLKRLAEEAMERRKNVENDRKNGIVTPGFRLVAKGGGEAESDDDGVVGSGANLMKFIEGKCVAVKKAHMREQVFDDKEMQLVANKLSQDIENFIMPTGPRVRKKVTHLYDEKENDNNNSNTIKVNKKKLSRSKKRRKIAFDLGDDNNNSSSSSTTIFVQKYREQESEEEYNYEEEDDDDDFMNIDNNSSSSSNTKKKKKKRISRPSPPLLLPEVSAGSALIKCGAMRDVDGSYKRISGTEEMSEMVDNIIDEYTEFENEVYNKNGTEDDYAYPFSLLSTGRHGHASTAHAPSSISLVKMLHNLVKESALALVLKTMPQSNIKAYAMQFGRVITRGSEISAQVDTVADYDTYTQCEIPIGIVYNAHNVSFEAIIGIDHVIVKPNQVLIFDKRIEHSMRKAEVKTKSNQRNSAKRFETSIVFNVSADAITEGGGARGVNASRLEKIFELQDVPYDDWMVYKQKWCCNNPAPPATSWYPSEFDSPTASQVRRHWVENAIDEEYLKRDDKVRKYITDKHHPKFGFVRPLKEEGLDAEFAQKECSAEDKKLFSWQSITF